MRLSKETTLSKAQSRDLHLRWAVEELRTAGQQGAAAFGRIFAQAWPGIFQLFSRQARAGIAARDALVAPLRPGRERGHAVQQLANARARTVACLTVGLRKPADR